MVHASRGIGVCETGCGGYDFFISYHWASGGAYAVNLAARLQEKGYDVFLDRGEYAMGDDWKKVGKVALRNTQRLVLIATREAVFASAPVRRDVILFTDRNRHVILIFFGDIFASKEQADPGKHDVLERLPDATLYIQDTPEHFPVGPGDSVTEQLVNTHRTMRRRKLRQSITVATLCVLLAFSLVATVSAIRARIAQRIATDQRDISEERRAQMSLQNGYGAIHSDHDVATGALWYAQALDAQGSRVAPLRMSARSLIGAWSKLLPRHSLVHDGAVTAIAFSPDGRTLATASVDRTARLWDVPPPVPDDPNSVRLAVEMATWKTVDKGLVRTLTQAEWLERKKRLNARDGDCLHRTWDELTEAEKLELRTPAAVRSLD